MTTFEEKVNAYRENKRLYAKCSKRTTYKRFSVV